MTPLLPSLAFLVGLFAFDGTKIRIRNECPVHVVYTFRIHQDAWSVVRVAVAGGSSCAPARLDSVRADVARTPTDRSCTNERRTTRMSQQRFDERERYRFKLNFSRAKVDERW